MSLSLATSGPVTRLSGRITRHSGLLVVLAAALLLSAAMMEPGFAHYLLIMLGAAAVATAVLSVSLTARARRRRRLLLDGVAQLIENGCAPQFVSDTQGRVLACNRAAREAPGHVEGADLAGHLGRHLATSDEAIARLSRNALASGAAVEEFSRQGNVLRVEVEVFGPELMHWRLDSRALRGDGHVQAGMPRLPMLTVGRTGAILFMNAAARTLLGERKKTLEDVFGPRGVNTSKPNTVHTAEGERQCLVAEFDVSAGRREIYLLPAEVPAVRNGAIQFDELPVPILKVARDGRVLLANRAARALIHKDITPHSNVSDLMEGLGRSIADWLAEAAAGHGGNHSEFLRLKREDRELFVQVSLNRVVEGETSSLIAVLNDATELKTLEAQFVQSQKMQAIGQLAGGVAHDFNNLLTAISGHCDLLLLRHDQGDPDFGDLVQINQNANRAAALVGQLLAFSRKQNLRPEVLDLRNTLADLTHLLNRLVGEKVELSLSNDPVLPAIRADKRQLEQVLMNLVVNARDAMPDGGEIRIKTESKTLTVPLERDRVVVPVGNYASVTVADDGVGIAPDKLQKVFEPFYTTKRTGEGTGLGLSTAYGIVKQTGGYIFVDSTLGMGTVFTLLFPVHDLADPAPVVRGEGRRVEFAATGEDGGVVLLVEDEAPVRSFASRALKLRGFTVLEAGSGEEALDLLASESPKVDIFVTDVIMPGMDGPSWVRCARADHPDTPVIFVSGYAEESFSDDQARIENSSFLPKPFSLADLTEAVQKRIRSGQGKLS